MFNSFILFIMLIAFKHTHLVSDYAVFLSIPLYLLSFFLRIVFFDKAPCPTSLNIVLYPSHWQSPLTVPRQNRQPLTAKMQVVSQVHFFFPHKAISQIYEPHFLFATQVLHLASFVSFSRFLYFLTIAVVPSLSALFVPM